MALWSKNALVALVTLLCAACSDGLDAPAPDASGPLPEAGLPAITFADATPSSRATPKTAWTGGDQIGTAGYLCNVDPANLNGYNGGTAAGSYEKAADAYAADLAAATLTDSRYFGQDLLYAATPADDGVNGQTYNNLFYYPTTQYWPSSPAQAIQFFAWHPSSAPTLLDPATADDGSFTGARLSYTVPAGTVAPQHDLLYASTDPLNQYYSWILNGKDTESPYAVGLTFDHALSQIAFQVKKKDAASSDEFFIRKITVSAIDKGELTINNAADPAASWAVQRNYPANSAGEAFSYGSWVLDFGRTIDVTQPAIPDGATAEEIADAKAAALAANKAAAATLNSSIAGGAMNYEFCDYDNKCYPKLTGGGTLYLNDGSHFLFMIPQQQPIIDKSVDTTAPTAVRMPAMTIDYIYNDGKEGEGHIHVDGYTTISIGDAVREMTATATDADPYIWETGKAYLYTLQLALANSVLVISATEWLNGNSADGEGEPSDIEVTFK